MWLSITGLKKTVKYCGKSEVGVRRCMQRKGWGIIYWVDHARIVARLCTMGGECDVETVTALSECE